MQSDYHIVSYGASETDSPPELVGPKCRKWILRTVVTMHVCVFLLPFFAALFASWLSPRKMTVAKVVFVDSKPNDNMIPSHHPGDDPKPNENPARGDGNPPPKLPDLPDDPGKLDPVPPLPPADVVPRIKKTVKKTVKKVVQTKIPEKKSVPVKKMHRYLDPKDIKITRRPAGRNTSRRSPDNSLRADALDSLARDIKRGTGGSRTGSDMGRGNPGGAGGPLGKYDPSLSDYHARLTAFLRSRWINPPSKNALGGRLPVVRVHFEIDSSGRILSMRIERCGVAVMDVSVTDAMRGLTALPVPPRGMPGRFYVNMRIDD